MVCESARHRGRNVSTGATQVGRLPIFHAMDLDGRARLASVLRPCYFHAGGEVWASLSLPLLLLLLPPPLRLFLLPLLLPRPVAAAGFRRRQCSRGGASELGLLP